MNMNPSLKRRYRADQRFKFYGMTAIAFALSFLAFFFSDIISKAVPAFEQAYVQVPVTYDESIIKNYNLAIPRELSSLVSKSYLRTLPKKLKENPELLGTTHDEWALASHRVDQYLKDHDGHGLKKKYARVVDDMKATGRVEMRFNSDFFAEGDSKMAENAGVLAAADYHCSSGPYWRNDGAVPGRVCRR